MDNFDEAEQHDRNSTAQAIRKSPKHTRSIPTIDRLRKIVEEKQAARIDGVFVDLFSASAVVTVYDGLQKEENKKKLASYPVRAMVLIALKLIK
jgi:hypothetical protein